MPKRRSRKRKMPGDAVFVLDIGTRTIFGLVGVQQGDQLIVQAAEILEHESRAMVDGQIHDISKVASGVSMVREKLEQQVGYSLNRVSIAAAGRVLKTCRVKVERELEEGREIDSQLVSAIEMEGIQRAQLEIDGMPDNYENDSYYCVGHSVVGYYLNDYIISSLIGHKGQKIGVEIIATFLPQMVVESLYTVIERAGLQVSYLTLEPIAALNVAIPKELRLLNLALVDIGAGTSDIAITKSGTIAAYAMAPVAGDEITEAIAQSFLVDFSTAEKIKREFCAGGTDIEFTDVLDNHITVKPDDVMTAIGPVVDQIAKTLGEKILECNGGKTPNAVFLVGGGSRTTGLCDAIAHHIGLPEDRVAIRNRSIARNIVFEGDLPDGPESITPLGILVTTGLFRGTDFYFVTVNGKRVKMFNFYKMRVSDVLALAGFNPEQLICKSGKRLRFMLNGENRTIAGGMGKPAEIMINGRQESLTGTVSPGDKLVVIPAEKGKDGHVTCGDLLAEFPSSTLKHNQETFTIAPEILVNGKPADEKTLIQEKYNVDIRLDFTISHIADRYGIDLMKNTIRVNGEEKAHSFRIQGGETIECYPKSSHDPEPENSNTLKNQDHEDSFDTSEVTSSVNLMAASNEGISVVVNGERILLPPKAGSTIFVDIFNHIDFDIENPKGMIVLKLNGKDASYTDVINNGDVIDIYWSEQTFSGK